MIAALAASVGTQVLANGLSKDSKDEKNIVDKTGGEGTSAAQMLQAGAPYMQAAGSFLESYMKGKEEKRRYEEEMRMKKQQIEHQQNLDMSLNNRNQESHNQEMQNQKFAYNTALRNDAQSQRFYMDSLEGLGK